MIKISKKLYILILCISMASTLSQCDLLDSGLSGEDAITSIQTAVNGAASRSFSSTSSFNVQSAIEKRELNYDSETGDYSGTVTVDGLVSGKATIELSGNFKLLEGTISMDYDLSLDNFADVKGVVLDGSTDYSMEGTFSAAGKSKFEGSMSGDVELTGDNEAEVKYDISYSLDGTKVTFKGSVEVDGEKYTL